MTKYKLICSVSVDYTVEIEAENSEEAHEKYRDSWGAVELEWERGEECNDTWRLYGIQEVDEEGEEIGDMEYVD